MVISCIKLTSIANWRRGICWSHKYCFYRFLSAIRPHHYPYLGFWTQGW